MTSTTRYSTKRIIFHQENLIASPLKLILEFFGRLDVENVCFHKRPFLYAHGFRSGMLSLKRCKENCKGTQDS